LLGQAGVLAAPAPPQATTIHNATNKIQFRKNYNAIRNIYLNLNVMLCQEANVALDNVEEVVEVRMIPVWLVLF